MFANLHVWYVIGTGLKLVQQVGVIFEGFLVMVVLLECVYSLIVQRLEFYLSVLFLFCLSISWSQSTCDLKDYFEDSQKWVAEINLLPEKQERKDRILKRILCEQGSRLEDISFHLVYIFDGLILPEIPKERNEVIELINPSNIALSKSLCEYGGIYPEKCTRGFVMFSGIDSPLFDNIGVIEVIKIERNYKKDKIHLTLNCGLKTEIAFKVENFGIPTNPILSDVKKLKKGRNRLVISSENDLNLISLNIGNEKILILI